MNKIKHKVVVTGYELDDIKSFIDKLEKNEVSVLIDIRELPLSRKKYFSKNLLNDQVKKKKIEYIHYKSLGSPKEIRHKLRDKSLSYMDFFTEYRKHLIENHDALLELAEMLRHNDICLMCYEEQTSACHRSIIIDELQKLIPNLEIQRI